MSCDKHQCSHCGEYGIYAVNSLNDIVKESRPKCTGIWIGGSGGHRVHDSSCMRDAVWWHPDDAFAYCSEHIIEDDKQYYFYAPESLITTIQRWEREKCSKMGRRWQSLRDFVGLLSSASAKQISTEMLRLEKEEDE